MPESSTCEIDEYPWVKKKIDSWSHTVMRWAKYTLQEAQTNGNNMLHWIWCWEMYEISSKMVYESTDTSLSGIEIEFEYVMNISS